ncbi:MAG: tRNA-intron lyase [Nanoarchaeota archaeon]
METQEIATAELSKERVIAISSNETRELYQASRFGEIHGEFVYYSLIEGLYLFEKGKITIKYGKKTITPESFIKKAQEIEPTFRVRYLVYKDLRNRGYIVKTALKFGADFRVYERGIKPGEDHAKWIVFAVHESGGFTWHEFSAKNRVAHSTRKKLLLGIVDEEQDVTYYECGWLRP